jgi:hypothetical protein
VQLQGERAFLSADDGSPISWHVLDHNAVGLLLWGDEDTRYFIPWTTIKVLQGALRRCEGLSALTVGMVNLIRRETPAPHRRVPPERASTAACDP